MDVQDPRFQAMFTSHLFNLDPSHPSYRRTKATESLVAEKQRRRQDQRRRRDDALAAQTTGERQNLDDAAGTTAGTTKRTMDPGLSLLVKSIKNKTEQFQARKKPKLL